MSMLATCQLILTAPSQIQAEASRLPQEHYVNMSLISAMFSMDKMEGLQNSLQSWAVMRSMIYTRIAIVCWGVGTGY